ncbi:MAG: hypothetical protein ABI772_12455 [Bacteroidota bacterium]
MKLARFIFFLLLVFSIPVIFYGMEDFMFAHNSIKLYKDVYLGSFEGRKSVFLLKREGSGFEYLVSENINIAYVESKSCYVKTFELNAYYVSLNDSISSNDIKEIELAQFDSIGLLSNFKKYEFSEDEE